MKNIYLADDDADDREMFGDIISGIYPDAEITYAVNGSSLMKTLDERVPPPPDVIFLDINMPLKNGHECIKEIKQVLKLKDIPVVIYSTSLRPADVEAMYAAGADYYIKKPDRPIDIKALLMKVCSVNFGAGYKRPSRDQFLLVA